jgi:hypothetical protein
MKSLIRTKSLAAAALAFGAFAIASAAHARTDVFFNVGVPAPVYVEPAPVYMQPQPVYVQPQPVYSPRPVYVAPTEVYVRRGPPAYEYRYMDERARRHAEWRHRQWLRHHGGYDGYRSHRDWD